MVNVDSNNSPAMKRFAIIFFSGLAALVLSTWFYPYAAYYLKSQPVPKPDALRQAIIQSIQNPFPQADTLLLSSQWWECGNTPYYARVVDFDTRFDKKAYRAALVQKIGLPVVDQLEFEIALSHKEEKLYNGRFNNAYERSAWANLANARILADELSPRKIRLIEQCRYRGTVNFIYKTFMFSRGQWTFHTTETYIANK